MGATKVVRVRFLLRGCVIDWEERARLILKFGETNVLKE
jgi:hypothetical protein